MAGIEPRHGDQLAHGGGANVVCEALRIGVPVLASRISGNVGFARRGYAGYFKVGDERDRRSLSSGRWRNRYRS
jgi:hypothetical protein